MTDDRPGWARRMTNERELRHWSQADAVKAVKAHAAKGEAIHADDVSLLRQWKRWEAGETKPGEFYQQLIARTFGTVTHAMFPAPSPRDPAADVLTLTGMDTLELVSRLQRGLLKGSFIPPAEIKAVRDVIRYRRKLVQQRAAETQRLGGVLQDAGIKLDSVASSIDTVSGLAMIRALIDGERRGQVPADLARGVMRAKISDLSVALEGRFDDHHALMCQLHLDHIAHLSDMSPGWTARGGDDGPFRPAAGPAGHDPGDRPGGRRGDHLRDRHQPG